MKKMGASDATSSPRRRMLQQWQRELQPDGVCGLAISPTIGLVIANVDHQIHEKMDIDPKYRSIGIIGDRTGAGPQIFAADEAVKATNCEIGEDRAARDTEGGANHGSLIIFGAEDVSDARRAVEVCLREVERTMGDVYGSPAGHLGSSTPPAPANALNKAFGAPIGKAFGITVGAPAAIGVLLADTAVKAATVDVVGYSSLPTAAPASPTRSAPDLHRRFRRRQAGHHRRPRCGHAGAEDPGAQRGAQVHHHPYIL